jgi:hypothetical protein
MKDSVRGKVSKGREREIEPRGKRTFLVLPQRPEDLSRIKHVVAVDDPVGETRSA